MQAPSLPPFDSLPLTEQDVRDLRSDHAGEHGAVAIYCGILAISRSARVRRFAYEHMRTELRHRRFFRAWLPTERQSMLLPVWWSAGWLLGATAAVFGDRSVFRTITAVETFVEQHYNEQIDGMTDRPELRELRALLICFCADEVLHRDDAAGRVAGEGGAVARVWSAIVGIGSAAGVALARRL